MCPTSCTLLIRIFCCRSLLASLNSHSATLRQAKHFFFCRSCVYHKINTSSPCNIYSIYIRVGAQCWRSTTQYQERAGWCWPGQRTYVRTHARTYVRTRFHAREEERGCTKKYRQQQLLHVCALLQQQRCHYYCCVLYCCCTTDTLHLLLVVLLL